MTWDISQLDPARTALAIVDMQGDFLDAGGACLIPGGRQIVPLVADLAGRCRHAGVPIVHIMTVWRHGVVDMSPFTTSEDLRTRGLREGEAGVDLVPELTAQAGDYVVVKKRYSGFYQTDLDLLLSGLGTRSLLVAGVATNFCVRATVHDASFRGLISVVSPETCRSYSPEEHAASLRDIANGFGYVVPLSTVLRAIDRCAKDWSLAASGSSIGAE